MYNKLNYQKNYNYIYTLSDPTTNIVRYIGKTKQDLSDRLNRHLQSYNLQYDTFKNKWILELKLNNVDPIIELLDIGAGYELPSYKERDSSEFNKISMVSIHDDGKIMNISQIFSYRNILSFFLYQL